MIVVSGAAAERGLVNFSEAITQLEQTTFRASPVLIQSLLQKFQDNDA